MYIFHYDSNEDVTNDTLYNYDPAHTILPKKVMLVRVLSSTFWNLRYLISSLISDKTKL
jgi:hypothetical protein